MDTGKVNAPEINTGYGWLNTDREYSIKDFRGKIVLLDFWTFGCINCQHIIPDLKKLEAEYPEELVVIGVHSAKFDAEKSRETIRKAILKFGIEHPVVNDADYTVWKQYAVNAWPTVVLIDPNGKVVGQKPGEGLYEVVKPHIEKLIEAYKNDLNRTIFPFKTEHKANGVLSFPSKMIADKEGNIYLSDSGHNRILKLDQQGKILETIGSGKWGWFALTEMVVFIAVLALGLAYAWAKGHLDWIKPKPIIPTSHSKVPANLYQQLNQQRSVHKKPGVISE